MNQMLPRPRFWADTAAELRPRFSLLGELLVFFLVYFLASMIQSLLVTLPLTAWIMGSKSGELLAAWNSGASLQSVVLALMEQMPEWFTLVSMGTTAAMGAAAVFYCRRFQKRSLASMGLRPGGLREYLLGFALGLGLLGLGLALGSALGGFRLAAARPTAEQLWLSLGALLGCVIQGAALELMFRGYLAPTLGARCSVGLALLLSTLASTMTQAGSSLFSVSGVNGLLLTLLLGIWVLKRGSLWGACALRAAWTFAGAFLFDFAPAGEHGSIRVFDVDADSFRPLLSGGAYGPMASICLTVVLLAAIMACLALRPKDPAPTEGKAEGGFRL